MRTFNVDQIVGQVIDHWRVEQFLNRSPLGVVYYAQREQHPAAITVFLLPQTISDITYQQFRARFRREAAALISLRHPHLLPLYGYGEWDGRPYLITPYTTKGSLATLIQRQGPWSSSNILPVLEQVAMGLEYAHRHGQIHGMLTPMNVVRTDSGNFLLAGLGLQRLLERRGLLACQQPADLLLTLAGSLLCPPKYLAPEYRQGKPVQLCSDIYSLGVLLAELHCGHLLPAEMTAQEILAWLKQQSAWPPLSFIQRALAEDPENRFPRVSDLLLAYTEQASKKVIAHKQQFRHPLPANPPLIPFSQNNPIQQNALQNKPLQNTSGPQWSFPVIPPPSLPLLETENNIPRPRRRRINRQRRKVVAALAGCLLLGAVGGAGFSRMLTSTTPTENVIGQTTQAANSAQAFLDQQASENRQRLLIHLPNGNFVAYAQRCTHGGVLVQYDPHTQMLVCPAHGAIFDPAQGGRVIKGPATAPLPQIAIHINSAGSITL